MVYAATDKASEADLEQEFVYGNGIDEPVIMYNTTAGDPNSAVYYYCSDNLGSAVALVDSSGDVVERYVYDVWGEPTIYNASGMEMNESTVGNPFMFTARDVDTLDGGSLRLQHNRHRVYNYKLARWMQNDPLGTVPGGYKNRYNPRGQYKDGVNIYEYVGNDPIFASDEYGLFKKTIKKCFHFLINVITGKDGDIDLDSGFDIDPFDPSTLGRDDQGFSVGHFWKEAEGFDDIVDMTYSGEAYEYEDDIRVGKTCAHPGEWLTIKRFINLGYAYTGKSKKYCKGGNVYMDATKWWTAEYQLVTYRCGRDNKWSVLSYDPSQEKNKISYKRASGVLQLWEKTFNAWEGTVSDGDTASREIVQMFGYSPLGCCCYEGSSWPITEPR